ncbi:MAG TPA: cupin-like domain-containing protein [Steroidobacteraceae bacterium]|nr:cupin-like domain-containing protein [Steroidobacteraceae bacterium]
MNEGPASVPEWHHVTGEQFRERIFPAHRPAILRGAVSAWPAVMAGSRSPQALAEYLLSLPQGGPVSLIAAVPSLQGRFFYRDDMRGPNFERKPAPLAAGIRALLAHLEDPQPPAIYMDSAPLPDCLPTFTESHGLDLLRPSVVPRIWIGNAVKVQTHYDFSSNIACVVAGRRRFTLFPPEQLPNLYVGPMDNTLAGVPCSMVRLDAPDLERYPRFRLALQHVQVAELGPGDALFIPYAWWHHVESLGPFNVLVNYWWNEVDSPLNVADSLLHALFAIRDLPPEQRAVWRNLFDYYVFQTSGEPLGHLAPESRGLMGARGEAALRAVRMLLLRSLSGS